MAISVEVDDHGHESVEWENGLTVGTAIGKAYKDTGEQLRPRDNQLDVVTVNGAPASYGDYLNSPQADAEIAVTTSAYEGEGVPQRERPPSGPPQKSRKKF